LHPSWPSFPALFVLFAFALSTLGPGLGPNDAWLKASLGVRRHPIT
jgi:hypothetical protein